MIDVTFVIVNFNTTKLLHNCLTTLLECYMDCKILIVDNGSANVDYIEAVSINNKNVACLFNEKNLTHGPAMHQAMHLCYTDYIFYLDSDCIIRKSGFLEEMMAYHGYAVGNIQLVNFEGVNVPDTYECVIRYVHPSMMLINREQYFTLPPFKAHGAPCIDNMRQANKLGLLLVDYPIGNFVTHSGRGTRESLNVGWDGKKKKRRGFLDKLFRR